MARYKVLIPIERGGVLYAPAPPDGIDAAKLPRFEPPGPFRAAPIPIDRSGVIELTDAEAGTMLHGQIPLYRCRPLSIEEMEESKERGKA